MMAVDPKAINTYYQRLQEAVDKHRLFGDLLSATVPEGWTIIPEEMTRSESLTHGSTIRDRWQLPRGAWYSLPPDHDLRLEALRSFPQKNTIFENTRQVVLVQSGKETARVENVNTREALAALLESFLKHSVSSFITFDAAAARFEDEITDAATALREKIKAAHNLNPKFIGTYQVFMEMCHNALNPEIAEDAADEMLIQHVLGERLIRTVFSLDNFNRRNVIAAEIEQVIESLEGTDFKRDDLLAPLSDFYVATGRVARDLSSFLDRRRYAAAVCRRYFRGFAYVPEVAGTDTPAITVDFMLEALAEVLKDDLNLQIDDERVVIVDPSAGTGNFLAALLRQVRTVNLDALYKERLFGSETDLLAYYLAALSTEHVYYERSGSYAPFAGLSLADTQYLPDRTGPSPLGEENAERIDRQQAADVTVVIGELPPHGPLNTNATPRKPHKITARVQATYAEASIAADKSGLQARHVRFIRWATDRLQGRDGVICLLSTNDFIDDAAFDGMRAQLLQDFTRVYHLDLRHQRSGITIATRTSRHQDKRLMLYRVGEDWSPVEVKRWLIRAATPAQSMREATPLRKISWQHLHPAETESWLKARPSAYSKDTKVATGLDIHSIFAQKSPGMRTEREVLLFDFSRETLEKRLTARAEGLGITFDAARIRTAYAGPLCKKHVYFDADLFDDVGLFPQIFPNLASEQENHAIWLRTGPERPVFALMVNQIVNDFPKGGSQVFPFYLYDADGSNRRENIPDTILARFRDQYGDPMISKWDVFYYVYALLYHPDFRARCAKAAMGTLPRIPLVQTAATFRSLCQHGERLSELHLSYEQTRKFTLHWKHDGFTTVSFRVEKMALKDQRRSLRLNDAFTLEGLPANLFDYRLGDYSALEWVINQYQVREDARTGITIDPNRYLGERYIVGLVERLVYVSTETVKIVDTLGKTPLSTGLRLSEG